MSGIVIDLNPRVREIIEQAITQSKPFWLGYMLGNEEIHSRLACYLVSNGNGSYSNANWIQTDPVLCEQAVDGCCLAVDKIGPRFAQGPLIHPRHLMPGDSLASAEGAITFTGKLP